MFVAFVLGLTASDMELGSLDNGAFVVGFPILGSILQCLLLPLVYDSPVSLGLIQDYLCLQSLYLVLSVFYLISLSSSQFTYKAH